MRRRLAPALLAIALLGALPVLAACGAEEEELDVKEGEPIIADDVTYNVVISRFLNPDDTEDAEYLADAEAPAPGNIYFGVFMQIENESDEAITLPDEMRVVDTLNTTYKPLEIDSAYALELGGEAPAGDSVPVPDSTAFDGPIQGSMVLFEVAKTATENRPLELEIPLPSGKVGLVELDI